MIPPRLIPVLLIDRHRRVVKTEGFGRRTYVGDPFNIIRLFNEKEVDEICVLEIDATADGSGPDTDFALALASECFMPLSYGGGIATLEQARILAAGGIEKLVLRSNATPELISVLAEDYGSQAVIGCVDYRGTAASGVSTPIAPGLDVTGASPRDVAMAMVQAGAGEIILQSIDRDGLRTGMDLEGISAVAAQLPVPIIALGGAGEADHLHDVIAKGATAAASGSAFCFIGRLRAVLVTYPEYSARQAMVTAK